MSRVHQSSLLQNLARWIEDYWASVSSLIGSFLLAFAGILPSVEQSSGWDWLTSKGYGIAFLIGSVLSLIGGSVTIILAPSYRHQQRRIAVLENELNLQKKALETELAARKQGYSKILNDELKILFQILSFSNTERISLYKYKPEENIFLMIARYSSNPIFSQPGRTRYPIDQGCIGRAWQDGDCFIDNLPDPASSQYYRVLESQWNMDQETVKSMTLKSRNIGAISISNRESERFAVIVFESIRTKKLRDSTIKNIINNCGESKRITLLLERVADIGIEPDLSYAYREGF